MAPTCRIERLGARVTADAAGAPLREGDRIVYSYFYPCRRCDRCRAGDSHHCVARRIGAGRARSDAPPHFTGAYADDYYLPPGHYVLRTPEALDDLTVAPLNCALSQVIYGLRKAGLQIGDTLVVQGAGGLGTNACAVAKEMGADQVIVIDGLPGRLELAKQFGADDTINLNEHNTPEARVQRVLELTAGRGGDVVAEFVGLPAAIPEGLQMTRSGGTYLEIGNISFGRTVEIDPSALVWGTKKIVGMIMYDPWVIPEALDYLVRTKNKYPHEEVVSHDKYKLADINKAFEEAEWQKDGTGTKVHRAVITM